MFKWILTIAFAGFLMIGCGGGGLSPEAQEALGLQGAPRWITMGDGTYSAVGSAPVVNKNIGFAKSEALTRARAELVKQLASKIKTSTSTESMRKDGTLTEQVKEEILSMAQLDLRDAQVSDMWATPDGKNLFVLVKLSDETVVKMKKAVENGGGDFSAFEQNLNTTPANSQATQAQ